MFSPKFWYILYERNWSVYERKTAGNNALLIWELVNVNYKEAFTIAKYLNEFQSVVNQLLSMKISPEDELQALLLLSSLPDSWKTLMVSLSNLTPKDIMSMSFVTSSLLNKELGRKISSLHIRRHKSFIVKGGQHLKNKVKEQVMVKGKYYMLAL